jgi:nucleotide-binding universal stress UspA family protein
MIPKITRILYATDLSSNANYAFGYALSVALSNNAKISIINVYEKLTNNRNIQMRSMDFESAKAKLTEKMKVQLKHYGDAENIEECLFTKLIDKIYVTSGMPVEAIIAQAKENDYDLIVMGTHGHSCLFRALIGSTAQKMVQESEIPVLVVRIPEK